MARVAAWIAQRPRSKSTPCHDIATARADRSASRAAFDAAGGFVGSTFGPVGSDVLMQVVGW
jgi:hypothetical protein